MIVKSRLHLYQHDGPKSRGYIIGEKQALRALSEALRKAADGVLGSETVTVYGNDGHDYEVFITRDVSEQEWQTLDRPEKLTSIQTIDQIKQELEQRNRQQHDQTDTRHR